MNVSFFKAPRWALRASLLLSAVLWAVAAARAGDAYWGVTAGDWNDPGNWGGGVPGNSDSAHVENGGTVEVTADTPAVQWADVSGNNGATSTFNLSGGKFSVSSTFSVGQYAAPPTSAATGVVNQSGGQLLTPTLVVGDMAGAVGLFRMIGGYAQAHVLYVGNFGTGEYSQSAGATWTGEQLDVGAQGGTGVFSLSGGTVENHQVVSIGNNGTGTLNVNDNDGPSTFTTTGRLYVGFNGNGTVNHSAVASAPVSSQGLYLGYTTGAHGTYTLSGAASLSISNDSMVIGADGTGHFTMSDSSSLTLTNSTNGTSLQVGQSGTGTFTMSGGSLSNEGALLVGRYGGSNGSVTQSGGVAAAAWTEVGSSDSATGNYHLSGGTLNAGGSLSVGNQGSGTFVQDAGTVNVSTFTVLGDTGRGSYTLNGGTLNPGTGDAQTGRASLTIGFNSAANNTFTQNGGVVQLGNWLEIGQGGGSRGTYNLTGGTLAGGSNFVVVGRQGVATFNQTGGTVTASALVIGYNSGGQGTYNLSGGNLNLAGNVIDFQGTATLNIDGGTLTVGGGGIAVNYLNVGNAAGSHGFHTMTDGQTTTVNNSFVVGKSGSGTFMQNGGMVSTPGLNIAADLLSVGAYDLAGGVLDLRGGVLDFGAGQGTFSFTGGEIQNLSGVHVESGGVADLNLSASTFFMGSLTIDSGGRLTIDPTNGPPLELRGTGVPEPTGLALLLIASLVLLGRALHSAHARPNTAKVKSVSPS